MEPTISSLIGAVERSGRPASEALFAALYSELHRVAKRELGRPGPPVTLSATTLLHQAYLDIAGREGPSFTDSEVISNWPPRFCAWRLRA